MKLGLILATFDNLKTFALQDCQGKAAQSIPNRILKFQESVEKERLASHAARSLHERFFLAHFSEILQNSEVVDFAATKFFGGTKQKAKNCTKGWACGYTCLSKKVKNCKKTLNGQAKTYAGWLRQQKKEKPSSPKSTQKSKIAPVPTTTIADPANTTGKSIAVKKIPTSASPNANLSQSIKSVGLLQPVVVKTDFFGNPEKTLHGEVAAASAQDNFAKSKGMLHEAENAIASQDSDEAEALAYQAKFFTPPKMDSPPPEPQTPKNMGNDSLVNPKLVAAKNVTLDDADAYDPEEVEAIAQSQLRVGNVLPVIVQRTGVNKFKTVAGGIAVAAAKRAREIDPKRAEMFRVFIADNDQDAAAMAWQVGDYGKKKGKK